VLLLARTSIAYLDRVFSIDAASRRKRCGPLLARTAAAAADGGYEPFKTSSMFDGTARHPEWLGDEPQRVRQLTPR
jgi:hypothetical protein